MTGKRIKPVRECLWKEDIGSKDFHRLIGSRCTACNEVFFPKKENGLCTSCQSDNLTDIELGPLGTVYSHTTVMMRPPGGFYKGNVPYSIGIVELPQGVFVDTLFSDENSEQIKIGAAVELVIEKLCDEGEDEVVTYMFRPVLSEGKI